MRRSPGRQNSSKLTIDDTGLPGSPNTGTRVPSARAMVPNASGLAGLMATCIQRMSPMRSSTTFTKSKSPMLTPPLVTSGVAGLGAAPAAAASMAASSSRDEAEVDGLEAALGDQRAAA